VTENYWGKNAIELRYAGCDHTVSSHAATPPITGTAMHAILNWPKNLCPDAARIVGSK
jgi:hypothetical protein